MTDPLQAMRHGLAEARDGLVRHPALTLLATLSIGVSLYVFGLFLLLVFNLGVPGPATAQDAPGPAASGARSPVGGLELKALLDSVAVRNPRLHAMEASADAAATRVAEASTLPDPMLQLGVMICGIPECCGFL